LHHVVLEFDDFLHAGSTAAFLRESLPLKSPCTGIEDSGFIPHAKIPLSNKLATLIQRPARSASPIGSSRRISCSRRDLHFHYAFRHNSFDLGGRVAPAADAAQPG